MDQDSIALLKKLLTLQKGGFLNFKSNDEDFEAVGKYISALANMAALADIPYGYLVYGVDDHTHEVVGTAFSLDNQKSSGISYRMSLNSILSPKGLFDSDTFEWTDEKKVTIIRVNKTPPCNRDLPGRRIRQGGRFFGFFIQRARFKAPNLAKNPQQRR